MSGKTESETVLGPDNATSADVNDDKSKTNKKEGLDLKKSLIMFFKSISVEPFLMLYVFANTLAQFANSNFYMEKACRADHNYTKEICLNVIKGIADDNMTKEALTNASISVTVLTSWKNPIQTAIPAIYVLFVGAWSDRTGNRKAVILIPVVGEIIILVGLVFANYNMVEWPLWVSGVLEVIVAALTGGIIIVLMGSFNYIADITTPETRTFRMAVVFFSLRVTMLACVPLAGLLTKLLSYYIIYGISIGIFIITFAYGCLRLQNVKQTETEGTLLYKMGLFFNPKNIWDTISVIFKSRGHNLAQILLIILVHMILNGPSMGDTSIMYVYTKNVFGMDILDYSLVQTWSNVISIIGIGIAATVFSKWLGYHDAVVGLIATTSNVLAALMYGLAPNRFWYYVGAVIDIFGIAGVPAIRSMATKLVQKEDVGKMCSLIGLVDSLTPSIYFPIFGSMIKLCLETKLLLGYVYILGAILTVPAFFIFTILYIIYKKKQRDVVQNVDIKEMHVYDNKVGDN